MTEQRSPLPWQGTKAERLSTIAMAHCASGPELEASKLISGALPVPYLSKGNVKLHVSNGFKIKEELGFFKFH